MRGLVICLATWMIGVHATFGQDRPGSYVVQHVKTADGRYVTQTAPYEPRAGDLLFFDEYKPHWVVLYKLVGSDGPHHSALVFKKADGEFCTVEAGPNDTLHCRILPLLPRLQDFKGTLHIRRVKTPVSAEREEALAKWAAEQDGKRYALGRLFLQTTPFRCRGPVRRDLFGATYVDRCSYMCAELAVAGGTVAGLFDPFKHPGNSIYPRDLIYDDAFNISASYHDAELWSAYPLRQARGKTNNQGAEIAE